MIELFRKNYTAAALSDRQPTRKGKGQKLSKSQSEQRQKKMEQKKQLRLKQQQRLADTPDEMSAAEAEHLGTLRNAICHRLRSIDLF